jgi:branched-chain amino acid transport system substrate-binding protein
MSIFALRNTRLLAAGILATITLAACASSSASESGSPIKIGFTTGLSGIYASYGLSLENGFKGGIAQINNAGGIDGRQLSVTYLDDASDPDTGSSNYTQLASSSIVVSGEVLSDVCDAIAPVAAQKGVAMFCMNSGPTTINPPQQTAFVAFVQSADWSAPSFQFAKTLVTAPAPRAAVMNLALSGSASYGDAVAKIASSAGWKVDHVQISPTDPNPGTAINQELANHPAVILANLSDTAAIQLAKSLASAHLNIPVIMTGGGLSYSTIASIASPNFYVLTPYVFVNPDSSSAEPAGVKQFVASVKAIGGDPNGTYTAAGYLQADLIGQALKDCGPNCDSKKFAAQLGKTMIKTGGVTSSPTAGFSATSHQAVSSLSVYSWDASTKAMKLDQAGLPVGSK